MDQTVDRGEVYPQEKIFEALADLPEMTFHKRHCEAIGGCDNCTLPACPIADQG